MNSGITSAIRPAIGPAIRSVFEGGFAPSLLAQSMGIVRKYGGALYDPSNLASLFQDSAGILPVTAAGQPVGLMLDMSYGLAVSSTERLRAPTDIGSASWTKFEGTTAPAAIGVTFIPSTNNAIHRIAQIPMAADGMGTGNTYGQYVEVVVKLKTAGIRYVYINGTAWRLQATVDLQTGAVSANATTRVVAAAQDSDGFWVVTLQAFGLQSTNVNSFFWLQANNVAGAGDSTFAGNGVNGFTVKSASFRNIPGNHASQATTTARPLYQIIGGFPCVVGDGVDDSLRTPVQIPAGPDRSTTLMAAARLLSESWDYRFLIGAWNTAPLREVGIQRLTVAGNSWAGKVNYGGAPNYPAAAPPWPVGTTSVLYFVAQPDVPRYQLFINNVSRVVSTANVGSNPNGPMTLVLFNGPSLTHHSNSAIFASAYLPAAATPAEQLVLTRFLASRSGAPL